MRRGEDIRARYGGDRLGMVGWGLVRQGEDIVVRRGWVWHGRVRWGKVRRGVVRSGVVGPGEVR